MVAVIVLQTSASAPAQLPGRDRPIVPTPVGTALVAGTVTTDGEKPLPLRRARVVLVNAEINFSQTIVTDETGRFAFGNVPAGRFTLMASKEAYVDFTFGARRPGGPGTTLTIADGAQLTGITLRLPKGGVITGTVTDAFGQPLADVQIGLLQSAFVNGERRLTQRASGRTDDRGVYRVFGLRPGQYVVSASSGRPSVMQNTPDILFPSEADVERAIKDATRPAAAAAGESAATSGLGVGRAVSYVPLFYPNATSAAQASVVDVAAGQERTGIDLQLQMLPSGRVEGTVTYAEGPLPAVVQITVNAVSNEGSSLSQNFRSGRVGADGRFEFGSLPPGEYVVAARANLPGEASGSSLWATASALISSDTAVPVALELRRGYRISGRLQFEAAGAPPSELRGWRVGLEPVLGPRDVSLGVTAADVQPDHTFTLQGATPGRFRFQPTMPATVSNDWMMRAADAGGRSVLDVPLELIADLDNVVITFTDRVSQVRGTVQDVTGVGAPDYYVILFPADRALWAMRSPRIHAIKVAHDGSYRFRKIMPGDYLIASTADVETGEWMDPSFLQRIAASALRISIAEGEQKVQDFKIEK